MAELAAYIGLVAGGHAAGKRTVCRDIKRELETETSVPIDVHLIDLADYQIDPHKPLLEFDRLLQDMDTLAGESQSAGSTAIIFVHGNYALHDKDLVSRARLRIFLDADADTRLSQWILRDVAHLKHGKTGESSETAGKRSLEDILDEYLKHCRPEYLKYIEKTKKNADVLLPRGSDELGIRLLANSVIDDVRQNLLTARVVRSQSPPPVNLRLEAVANLDQRYYTAS